MKKILLVEDAKLLAEAVKNKLIEEGFDVSYASNGVEALELLSSQAFSVVLLDINLPKMNGFEVAKAIKELGYQPKIIGLTARDSIEDKLEGFGLGFDDYVVKPFDMRELVARIKAATRPDNEVCMEIMEVRGLHINVQQRSIMNKGKEVPLTKLEFDLFVLLLSNSPAVVENDMIIQKLWGDELTESVPPIRSHIKNLRKKIGDKDFSLIITVPGVGYKIEEEVTCQDR